MFPVCRAERDRLAAQLAWVTSPASVNPQLIHQNAHGMQHDPAPSRYDMLSANVWAIAQSPHPTWGGAATTQGGETPYTRKVPTATGRAALPYQVRSITPVPTSGTRPASPPPVLPSAQGGRAASQSPRKMAVAVRRENEGGRRSASPPQVAVQGRSVGASGHVAHVAAGATSTAPLHGFSAARGDAPQLPSLLLPASGATPQDVTASGSDGDGGEDCGAGSGGGGGGGGKAAVSLRGAPGSASARETTSQRARLRALQRRREQITSGSSAGGGGSGGGGGGAAVQLRVRNWNVRDDEVAVSALMADQQKQ
jgi:hypothetical protein